MMHPNNRINNKEVGFAVTLMKDQGILLAEDVSLDYP